MGFLILAALIVWLSLTSFWPLALILTVAVIGIVLAAE